MIDWEAVINADGEDPLKELKLFLFRENSRLENEKKEMQDMQNKFVKERTQFRDEMNLLNHTMVMEKKRLKDENLFFEKKMQILQDGFRQLEMDRRKLDKERGRFQLEKEWIEESVSHIDEGDIAKILFRGANNPLTIRKRYKDLMKIFHPDNLCGDAQIVQIINREYEKRKAE